MRAEADLGGQLDHERGPANLAPPASIEVRATRPESIESDDTEPSGLYVGTY